MRRVAVTGVGVVSPIGNGLTTVTDALRNGRHGIVPMPEWGAVDQLATRLAGRVTGALGNHPRQKVRAMGRVSLLALAATEQALVQAQLDSARLLREDVGLAYGSTHGSTAELASFCSSFLARNSLAGIAGSSYLKFMSHTCAASLAQYYGIRGRVVPTVAACASSSQAVGTGYETIREGKAKIMVCGGAEELHVIHASVFDLVYAASTAYNERPAESPRPFDAARDGLVVAEGAGTLVLEDYDHALTRGASILAEVVGYATNCDGEHVTTPAREGMAACMQLALRDAGIDARRIDYINAHATGTEVGDIAESWAVHSVFGQDTLISSTKGFTGHTLGACGAIEAAFCIAMLEHDFVAPNRNLENVDERCAPLAYVTDRPVSRRLEWVMTNNFAFGGINTSLVIKR